MPNISNRIGDTGAGSRSDFDPEIEMTSVPAVKRALSTDNPQGAPKVRASWKIVVTNNRAPATIATSSPGSGLPRLP